MEDRFEKQEVMLQESQDRQTDKLIAYVDKKFDEKFEELKDYSEALVENVKAEVGGAYKDEFELVKDRVTRLERKAGIGGKSSRIV